MKQEKQQQPAEVIELDDDDDAFWSSLSIRSKCFLPLGTAFNAVAVLELVLLCSIGCACYEPRHYPQSTY
jgi:hypothetical protein